MIKYVITHFPDFYIFYIKPKHVACSEKNAFCNKFHLGSMVLLMVNTYNLNRFQSASGSLQFKQPPISLHKIKSTLFII